MDSEKIKRSIPLLGVGATLIFLLFMSFSTFMISSRASKQKNITESYAEEFLPGATLPPGRIWQGIEVTGDLEGRLTVGYKIRQDDSCGGEGIKLAMGKIDGNYYVFNFKTVTTENGNGYRGYLQLSPLDTEGEVYGGNVLIMMHDDGRSGTVTGDLYNSDKSVKKIHMIGDWACP